MHDRLYPRFGFIPKTYVLPQDSKMLRAAWERSNGKEAWIIKPVNLPFLNPFANHNCFVVMTVVASTISPSIIGFIGFSACIGSRYRN